MDKKANSLYEVTIFTIFALLIFSLIYFGLERVGNQASFYEQVYAKQIAILIDKAEPGMEINFNTFDMDEISQKNKFKGDVVKIDNELKNVKVCLTSGNCYKFDYFNNNKIVWSLDNKNKILHMEFLGGGDE